MKKTLTLILMMLGAAVFAADGGFDVKNIRLFTRFTPVVKYVNESVRSKSSKETLWLCMEATFVPEARGSEEDQWYDDVTMEGMLVIARQGKELTYIVLTGKTRFFTIHADAKNHSGVFFVPSKILQRYLGTWGGTLPSVQMARISFYAPGKILLGEGFWAQGSGKKGRFVPLNSKDYNAVAARMKEYEKNYRNIITLRGGLYSKEKTPWSYVDYDFYDLIYDNVLQQDSDSIKK